jgi:hypothetical protein
LLLFFFISICSQITFKEAFCTTGNFVVASLCFILASALWSYSMEGKERKKCMLTKHNPTCLVEICCPTRAHQKSILESRRVHILSKQLLSYDGFTSYSEILTLPHPPPPPHTINNMCIFMLPGYLVKFKPDYKFFTERST